MDQTQRKLLVLDVDETLVHGAERRLERDPDFKVGPFFVYRRPHLDHFLKASAQFFNLAVWSAGGEDYVGAVVRKILAPVVQPLFVWTNSRCTPRFDIEAREQYAIKDLRKIRRKGFNLERVLVVDNDPRTAIRNYGNLIQISSYAGETDDEELKALAAYLSKIHGSENFRLIEKRGWRQTVELP